MPLGAYCARTWVVFLVRVKRSQVIFKEVDSGIVWLVLSYS